MNQQLFSFHIICALKIIDSSAENFETRFIDFEFDATIVLVFEYIFSVGVNDTPENGNLN
jgi:hypothetical protein